MSRAREVELLAQRESLLRRQAELRLALARQAESLAPAFDWADRLHAGWRWLRANPEWPIGIGLVVLLLQPRRALRWGLRLWWGVNLLRRLQALKGPRRFS